MAGTELFTSDAQTCAYLPDRLATQEYALTPQLAPERYEALMNAGYRKFGMVLFRPICQHCTECRPIRIPVDRFAPDRGQRRCMKLNADLEVRIGEPVTDSARVELYNRYHAERTHTCGWDPQTTDAEQYAQSFVLNPLPAFELSVWENGVLRGVAYNDVTPNVVSAVYHFYDPDLSSRGLGSFMILNVLAAAKMLSRHWVYLGYYVRGCASMEYKKRYRPYEIMDVGGRWSAGT
jgi:leucyl-tRNA---protein transferase